MEPKVQSSAERREYQNRYRRQRREALVPYLYAGTLARFAALLTWREIHALDRGKTSCWWRTAVVDAECRGLLCWYPGAKCWGLTDEGRKHVRDVA